MEQTKELCKVLDEAEQCGPEKKFSFGNISAYNVIIRMIGLLLARAVPFAGLAPFGISFAAMERRFSAEAVISALMVSIGYVSLCDSSIALRYICACSAYLLFLFVAGRSGEDVPGGAAKTAAMVSVALGRVVEMIWLGFSFGGVVLLLCDAVLVGIGIFIFEKNRGLLLGKKGNLFSLSSEEKLCLGVLAGIVFVGFKSLEISGIFSAANVIGLWTVIVFAMCGGAGAAAVCGIIIGLLAGIGSDILIEAAVFTICAAAAGVMSRYGKLVSAGSAALVAAAAVFYCGEAAVLPFGYSDIPLAVILIILTPDSALRALGRITGIRRDECDDAERCREHIKTRLGSAADSFRALADTFLDLSDKHNAVDMEDISIMFDSAADSVCRECPRLSECWVTGFNSTYKSMFRMLEIMERKGELKESDADEHFSKKCLKLRAMVREMNRLFEIYKINCVWKSKLCENRELAGQQLGSVAQILDSIADELYEERVDNGAEDEIRIRLRSKQIEVRDIDVTVDAKGRYSAYIRLEELSGGEAACCRAIEGAFRAVLGVKMIPAGVSEMRDKSVTIRFVQPEGYRIELGTASAGKGEECGDNCAGRYLSDGKYAAALSDGMGTGRRASRDSSATVRLLGDFLEAGFDKTIAVRLINSIMVMKSANEAFATVDMCVMDLFSGEAEFIKNGAEPSYIKRKDGTETVRAASLPVGVVQDMEIESFAHRLNDGDFIVMLSDGIQMKNGHGDWIKKLIEEADANMPAQELADRIMDMSVALKGGVKDDDMTVMTLKVHKR